MQRSARLLRENPPYTVTYDKDATLYKPETGDYPGVYTVAIDPNTDDTTKTEKSPETIGMPSIADKNLPNVPTTESPAIIQGAAVSYENKVGPTEYEKIDGRTASMSYP